MLLYDDALLPKCSCQKKQCQLSERDHDDFALSLQCPRGVSPSMFSLLLRLAPLSKISQWSAQTNAHVVQP